MDDSIGHGVRPTSEKSMRESSVDESPSMRVEFVENLIGDVGSDVAVVIDGMGGSGRGQCPIDHVEAPPRHPGDTGRGEIFGQDADRQDFSPARY
jgi:hypothetical protein